MKQLEQRIEEKIMRLPESGCWLWDGCVTRKGYGWVGSGGGGRAVLAHRYVYERMVGPIPTGLTLDHLCRVRCCVNPAHLEPVTAKVNTGRGSRATQTHCYKGHPFAGENLYVTRKGRECKECRRMRRHH